MIKDPELLARFERDTSKKLSLTIKQAYALLDAMWEEAVFLGVLPPADPLEGIEVDIRIAKAINSCSKSF